MWLLSDHSPGRVVTSSRVTDGIARSGKRYGRTVPFLCQSDGPRVIHTVEFCRILSHSVRQTRPSSLRLLSPLHRFAAIADFRATVLPR